MSDQRTTPGFHHVAIRAVDFDATVKFYTEGLGCTEHFGFSVPGRIDRAVFLDAGDGRYIEVFGSGSTVQAEGRRRQPGEEPTEGALLHFCLRVADVDASYARALAAGGGLTGCATNCAAWWRTANRGAHRVRHWSQRRGHRVPEQRTALSVGQTCCGAVVTGARE